MPGVINGSDYHRLTRPQQAALDAVIRLVGLTPEDVAEVEQLERPVSYRIKVFLRNAQGNRYLCPSRNVAVAWRPVPRSLVRAFNRAWSYLD